MNKKDGTRNRGGVPVEERYSTSYGAEWPSTYLILLFYRSKRVMGFVCLSVCRFVGLFVSVVDKKGFLCIILPGNSKVRFLSIIWRGNSNVFNRRSNSVDVSIKIQPEQVRFKLRNVMVYLIQIWYNQLS